MNSLSITRIRDRNKVQISSDYIYHIIVDGSYYIGQTSKANLSRIEQHFRGAYYKERHRDGYSPTLYDRMRQYKMQDICVEIFPGPNYGIPNFNSALAQFQQEWVDTKGAPIAPLDFAEIYHILWYGGKQNKKLFNTELGGRYIKSLKYNLPTVTSVKPILTTKTPVKDAYKIVMHGGLSFAQVQQLTDDLYQLLFDSQWPNNIQKSSLVPPNVKIPSNMQMSWANYVKNQLIPYILDPNIIKEYLLSNITFSQNKIAELAQQHIWDNFLQPRDSWIKNNIFNQLSFAKLGINFSVNNFNLAPLAQYLAEVTKRLIYESFNKNTQQYVVKFRPSVSQQKTINSLATIVPIRISVVWNTKGVKRQPGAGKWLSQPPVNPTLLPDSWYQHRSLLFFDWIFTKTSRKLPLLESYIIPYSTENNSPSKKSNISQILGKPIVRMNDVMRNNTLSAALRSKYLDYAPAYTESWLAFYKPMVSAWRYATKKEQMSGLSILSNNKTYWFYENAQINAFLVYKAHVFDVNTRETDLKIY